MCCPLCSSWMFSPDNLHCMWDWDFEDPYIVMRYWFYLNNLSPIANWCTNTREVKYSSINPCQVRPVVKAWECIKTLGVTVLGLQVQSPLEVNFMLNLFYSSLQSDTEIPDLPTLCNYWKPDWRPFANDKDVNAHKIIHVVIDQSDPYEWLIKKETQFIDKKQKEIYWCGNEVMVQNNHGFLTKSQNQSPWPYHTYQLWCNSVTLWQNVKIVWLFSI